jgi:hypothetical protein
MRSFAPAATQAFSSLLILATVDSVDASVWSKTLAFLSFQITQIVRSVMDRAAFLGISGRNAMFFHQCSADSLCDHAQLA